MPREKFKTLTEQMFYVLLCLHEEGCGSEISERIHSMTQGRVSIGSGTLYDLLEQFTSAGMIIETKLEGRRRSYRLTQKGESLCMIIETKLEGRRRSYRLTQKGESLLSAEYQRLRSRAADYERIVRSDNEI